MTESFHLRLGQLRKSAGMTQGELARAIGAAQSTVSQLEAGTRRPSYDMLQAIARAMRVTVGYLVSNEVEGLSQDEEAHFREYRTLTPEARDELRAYARFLRERHRDSEG